MSGTLPPSYNPNDSLLSGGDSAKIMPVQGGGFVTSVNYNADASLLSGGENVKIEPVQGGGAKTAQEVYDKQMKEYRKKKSEWEQRKKEFEAKAAKAMVEYESKRKKGELSGPPPRQAFDEPAPVEPRLTPLESRVSPINENNTNNNNNNNNNESNSSSSFSGVPSGDNIDNLDVYVLLEGNEVPSPNELAETIEEESKKGEDEEEEPKPLEVPCPVPDKKDVKNLSDTFEANDAAVDSKTKEIIRLASREYYIRQAKRKPVGKKKDDDIMSDWKEQTFTEDEADFLNTLGFSPKLLYSSFYCHEKDWKVELAEFLYHLSVNSCYPASSLLLKGECQRVREFLMIVESNLKAEQLRKLAEKPLPVTGPITLPELEEVEEEKGGKEGENENENTNAAHLHSIKERMGKLNVDNVAKETKRKSIAAKIVNFFKGFSKKKSSDESAEEAVMEALEGLDDEDENEDGEEDEEEYQVPEESEEVKSTKAKQAAAQEREAFEKGFQLYREAMIKENPALKDYNDESFREDYKELLAERKK
jgi:hypothetical protein